MLPIILNARLTIEVGDRPKNWLWGCESKPYPNATYRILGFNLWTLSLRLKIGNWRESWKPQSV